MTLTITNSEFLSSPGKYLDLTRGAQQVNILNDRGETWAVMGAGSLREVTQEEIEENKRRIDAVLADPGAPEPTGSWFD